MVNWIRNLKNKGFIPKLRSINLVSVAMISDGNATSQSPYAEVVNNMEAEAGVLFDDDHEFAKRWPVKIESVVIDTQKIASYFYWFAKEFSELRGIKDNSWANKATARFYDQLNIPFYAWLSSLTNDDDREVKVKEWRKILTQIVTQQAREIFTLSASQEIIGRDKQNVFTIYNKLRRNIHVYFKSK